MKVALNYMSGLVWYDDVVFVVLGNDTGRGRYGGYTI